MLTFFIFLSSFFSNTIVIISHVDVDYIFNLQLYVQFIIITIFVSFSSVFVLSNTLILFFLCLLQQVLEPRLFRATFGKKCITILVVFIWRFFAYFLCFFGVVFALYIFFRIYYPQKIYVIQIFLVLSQPSKSLIISLIIQNLLQNQVMKRVFIFTGDHEGKPEKIRFYSQFYRPQNIDQIKNQDIIAQTHIITSSKSYFATLKRRNINRELAWNTDLMNKLQNVLSGKSPDLITYLEERQFKSIYLVVATQFQTKFIRVILFEVEVTEIDIQPFALMRKLMNLQHLQRQECLKNYKIRQQKQRQKVDQIDQLYNQISQNHRDETNLMKQMFIPVINNGKKKLTKCFGFQDNQDLYQSEQNKSAELQRLRRQFYRIKQPIKAPQSSQKVTEVEHLFGMQ